MAEKKLNVKDTVATKSKTTSKTSKESKPPAKPKLVELIWEYNTGLPGQRRSFYGLDCIADKAGVYSVLVDKDVADRELNRAGRKTFTT